MSLTVEAIYENGVLKPAQPLPLKEHEQVRLSIQQGESPLVRAYGIMGWTGDAENPGAHCPGSRVPPRGGPMILADLAANDAIFIDSNILIYHFGPHPTFGSACNLFIQRIEKGELHGFTSTHVLAEVAHQLMIAEAS